MKHFIIKHFSWCSILCKRLTALFSLTLNSNSFSSKKNSNMVDQAVLDKLEAGFTKVSTSDSKSLLKKYLTKEVFDQLKTKKTSFNSTLLDVIQSGVENLDSGVGIYAPDAESYTVFADLFDPIIEDYHGGFKKTDKHPPKDFGDVDTLGNLDPAVSIRNRLSQHGLTRRGLQSDVSNFYATWFCKNVDYRDTYDRISFL